MTTPELAVDELKHTKAWEYLVRFAFGGAITVGTGLVGKHFGPVAAGMFLAFPAILPASLTLVNAHDGRRQCVDDARGARLGTLGLVAFAATVVVTVGGLAPWIVLTVAALMWALVDVGAWFLRYSAEDNG